MRLANIRTSLAARPVSTGKAGQRVAKTSRASRNEHRLSTSVPIDMHSLDAADRAKHMPWNAPWWRATRGDRKVLLWVILIHLGACVGLALTPCPSWRVLGCAASLYFLGGLGTTVCFHRAIAH